MKKYIYTILASLLFASCADNFLDIPSKTSLSTDVYYKSEKDFEYGINGVYSILRDLYSGSDGAWAMGELRSDNTIYAYNPNDRGTISAEFVNNFLDDATNSVPYHKYRDDYSIISNVNYLLDAIDNVSFDEKSKNNIKGQAYFLRAFAYMDLVQYFGKVPMHLTPVKKLGDATQPLASIDSIYAQIIDDATNAASLLPNKESQEAGRVTSGTANMLLGNVYINLKRWNDAETVLKKISGYSLLSNYSDVFDPANKNNAESLFEVQFKEGNDGYNSNFFYVFLAQPITADETAAITGISEIARIVEGYNIPTPDIINSYENGDLRKEASIGMLTAHGVHYPYIKKYCHKHALTGNTNDNWPVYRYAETLLYLAESVNEQGRGTEALTYLNQVRKRAGLPDCQAVTKDEIRSAILKERRVELAFENKRWLDLVHSGTAETVMKDFGQRVKNSPQDYYFPNGYSVAPQAFSTISTTFPLPSAEAALTVYF